MTVMAERIIRQMADKGNLRISRHAYQRMKEREILIEQVYESIVKGMIIEQQDMERDPKLVFQEYAPQSVPTFYVIVTCQLPPKVVSVCLFEEEKWEFRGGRMVRR